MKKIARKVAREIFAVRNPREDVGPSHLRNTMSFVTKMRAGIVAQTRLQVHKRHIEEIKLIYYGFK